MQLHNKINRKELIEQLNSEPFRRETLSFYRYVKIEDPQLFRDSVYMAWNSLNCFGRIYVAREGINAQMSVPEYNLGKLLGDIDSRAELKDIPIKYALDNEKSFFKLTIKVRPKIVADGLDDEAYNVTDVGKHLSPKEFHSFIGEKDTIVIDMRNHYESEIGRFENAYCPDADTFRDAIKIVEKEFENKKDKKILLYCTGGVRCEKASAYLKHLGFNDVNQLYGGIIAYAHDIKQEGLESKFTGKNFVFDSRLGEPVDGKVISRCHQCGELCDTHTNCANDDCHLLFIQCSKCAAKYSGCCSDDCKSILSLPADERKAMRRERHLKYAESKIFKSRLRPKLAEVGSRES